MPLRAAPRGPLVLALLFLLSAAVTLAERPYGGAFVFSDHFAHMNAARLFPGVGLDLWTTPIATMFRPATQDEERAAPADVVLAGHILHVPWWPDDKPYVGGWTGVPRPYPPGDLVVVAPIAVLYAATPLPFAAACHLLVLWFLLLAHATYAVVWRNRPAASPAYVAAAAVSYAFVVFWTLRGFYDAAAMLPLALSAAWLGRGRPFAVLAALGVALFIHFRALFYVPWAVAALAEIARTGAWRRATKLTWVAVVTSVILAASALFTLALVSPALSLLPLENPLHPGHLKLVPVAAFAASLVTGLALTTRARAWLDVAMLAWLAGMLVAIRQVQAWHAFLLFPWLFAAAARESVRWARVGFVATVTLAVFL